jgi:hypothetical protein
MDFVEKYHSQLLAMLNDTNIAVQISAARILSEINKKEITEKLFLLLGTKEELDEAIFALLEKRDTILEDLLAAVCEQRIALNVSTISFVAKAARSLVITKYFDRQLDALQEWTMKGFEIISSQWHTASDQTREVIVDALFSLDSNRAFEFFLGLAEEADPWSKMQIIELIAKIENPKSADYVARFMNDEDENVRELAAAVLDSKGVLSGQEEKEG